MSSVAAKEGHLKTGDKLIMTLSEGDDQATVYQAEYLVEQAPEVADAETQLRVKLLSENWRSPRDQAFHEPPSEPLRGGVKDGLEVAKFAWDIIKDNKPKARGPGTMTSVLIAGSNSLDYVGAKEAQSQKMILSVKDAMWPHPEYIRVEFRLEGTYRATPAKPDLPNGHYLPSF